MGCPFCFKWMVDLRMEVYNWQALFGAVIGGKGALSVRLVVYTPAGIVWCCNRRWGLTQCKSGGLYTASHIFPVVETAITGRGLRSVRVAVYTPAAIFPGSPPLHQQQLP